MERDQISMLVAKNIKALMEARGMTAASLGRVAELNPTGVYDILSGKSQSPKVVTLGKIATALNVPLSTIFDEDTNFDIQSDIAILLKTLGKYAAQLDPEKRELLLRTARAWSEEAA